MTTPAVISAGAGDGNDAARLYAKYGNQLYRFCLARLRSREEAEDAVQNTFLRVHSALDKGVIPRFEAAWLYKIAHNVCLSRSEAAGRRARVETLQDFRSLDYAAPDVEHDELVGLSDALGSMPKNLRDAILLREWQGLSYGEIAEAMGTSVSAVETLIFRARRQLAATLEPAARRPATSRLLDAGTLYGALRIALARLRGLLVAAAPAKLAAGTAAVAIGGGAVGALVAIADDPPHPAHGRPLPAGSNRAPGAVPVSSTSGIRTVVRPTAAMSSFPARPAGHTGLDGGSVPVPPPASGQPSVPTTEPAGPVAAPPAAAPAPAVTAPALPAAPTAPAPPELPALRAPPVAIPTLTPPTVDPVLPPPTVPPVVPEAVQSTTTPAAAVPALPLTIPAVSAPSPGS